MNSPSHPTAALEALRAAAHSDLSPSEGFVVGTVGPDVPFELIHAADAATLRLRGNPQWDLSDADHYLGTGLDAATRAILAGILDGKFGRLDAIVVSSDCDASQRLYYTLREIRRVDEQTKLPQIHLIDILHLPRESTARYNLRRMHEFAEVLREWTGAPLDAAALGRSIASANERRALQREVLALRSQVPSVLSGVDAQAILTAADRMDSEQYDAHLRALLDARETLPEVPGRRVFLTGSDHDRAAILTQIESAGSVIVGDDHGWGELTVKSDVEGADLLDEAALLDALARRYQALGPTAQRGSIEARAAHTSAAAAERQAELVISYVRTMDEAGLWDFATQRQKLAAHSIAAGIAPEQQYGEFEPSLLQLILESPEKTNANGVTA